MANRMAVVATAVLALGVTACAQDDGAGAATTAPFVAMSSSVAAATAAPATRVLLEENPLWANLPTVRAGTAIEKSAEIWMSAVGMFGAHAVLDDLAATFGVDPAREEA